MLVQHLVAVMKGRNSSVCVCVYVCVFVRMRILCVCTCLYNSKHRLTHQTELTSP